MYRIIIITACVALLQACAPSSGGSGTKKSAISGYEWEHLIENATATPNVGDFVYFNMDIFDDRDSLLQTYRNQKTLPSVQVLAPTDVNRKKNPLVDIISNLSVGDSAAVWVPVDSVPSMPPGLEYIGHIEYHVVVAEILTQEENATRVAAEQEKQMEQMTAMKARLPEVEELTEGTLAKYKNGSLEVQETPAGVKYFIHEKGDGSLPVANAMVTMAYYGRTVADGQRFDDSFNRGRSYTFRVKTGQVIQGWHDIAPHLPVGTKASVFIPAQLGYGERGSPPNIGPGAELYFYLEVDEMFY